MPRKLRSLCLVFALTAASIACTSCSLQHAAETAQWATKVAHGRRCTRQKKFQEAEDSFHDALKFADGFTGVRKDVARFSTLHGLSLCLIEEKKNDQAYETLEQALSVASKLWGGADDRRMMDSISAARYAECCNDFAVLKHQRNDDASARELYEHALRIERKHSLDTTKTDRGIAELKA